jgi:preprotein translocase subunit SecG
MRKSGGFIALLLVAAILLTPFGKSHESAFAAESSKPVFGDDLSANGAPDGNSGDTAVIIAVVIIVAIIFFFVTDTDNQSHERR